MDTGGHTNVMTCLLHPRNRKMHRSRGRVHAEFPATAISYNERASLVINKESSLTLADKFNAFGRTADDANETFDTSCLIAPQSAWICRSQKSVSPDP
jgi:hypothetical protein